MNGDVLDRSRSDGELHDRLDGLGRAATAGIVLVRPTEATATVVTSLGQRQGRRGRGRRGRRIAAGVVVAAAVALVGVVVRAGGGTADGQVSAAAGDPSNTAAPADAARLTAAIAATRAGSFRIVVADFEEPIGVLAAPGSPLFGLPRVIAAPGGGGRTTVEWTYDPRGRWAMSMGGADRTGAPTLIFDQAAAEVYWQEAGGAWRTAPMDEATRAVVLGDPLGEWTSGDCVAATGPDSFAVLTARPCPDAAHDPGAVQVTVADGRVATVGQQRHTVDAAGTEMDAWSDHFVYDGVAPIELPDATTSVAGSTPVGFGWQVDPTTSDLLPTPTYPPGVSSGG